MSYAERLSRLPTRCNGPVPIETLMAFETDRVGCRFPEDYRQFVMECNGCTFNDLVNFVSLQPMYPEARQFEGALDCLYGLSAGKRDLQYALERYSAEFPKGCISIGKDMFGNQLLIETVGEACGMIRFWDHEYDVAQGENLTAHLLPLVARSFGDFIDSLHLASP